MALPPLKHRVRQGESLVRLAARYQVPMEVLVAVNHIKDARLLWIGQELIIPQGTHSLPTTLSSAPSSGAARNRVVASRWTVAEGETLQSTLAFAETRSLVTSMIPEELTWWFQFIFGQDVSPTAIQRLRSAVLDGTLPAPQIVIVKNKLDGHVAAYHAPSQSILLSRELVHRARDNNNEAWKLFCCLVEEFGHHLDHLLRTHYSSVGGDAPLDEGARMAYSLVDFGLREGSRRREVARYTTREGSFSLGVQYTEMTTAAQHFVSDAAQRDDGRKGVLEYFGSGRGSGDANSFGHESIEDSLGDAGFESRDRNAIYFGNWMRDFSQVIDPKIVRPRDNRSPTERKKSPKWSVKPTRSAVTRILDVMAREKFGNLPHFKDRPYPFFLQAERTH